jgi:hypothetical protein
MGAAERADANSKQGGVAAFPMASNIGNDTKEVKGKDNQSNRRRTMGSCSEPNSPTS